MIWCVEDDASIRDIELYALKSVGLEARGFANGEDFWQAAKNECPDLIVLDIMLPGVGGVELLDGIRNTLSLKNVPVIMATAKGSEYDRVIGLDSGADDYLSKPFGMMEMVSRTKAVLRRTEPKQTKVLTCGGISLDEVKHTVSVGDKNISLTLKEYELLKLLMENYGQVFTRDTLLGKVWGMDFTGETRTVDVHIGTLRTKLFHAGNFIKTVRGVGYKMEE